MLNRFLAFLRGESLTGEQQDHPVPADPDLRSSNLSDEENERFASLVQLVRTKCQYAGSIAEDIVSGTGDDYDRARVEQYINTALGHADEIQDEFYKSAALQPIVELLAKAGQFDRASELISQIQVDFIREKTEATVARFRD